MARIWGGLLCWAAMLLLGLAAKTGLVTGAGTRVDEDLAGARHQALTLIARTATVAAQPAVGIAAALVAAAVLWRLRRRRDAVVACCLMAGALLVTLVVK